MIRVISIRKAFLAGAAGALLLEMVVRLLVMAGVPGVDMVRTLGTIVFPDGPAAAWWPIGVFLHVGVGVLWAIFYAYFFWSLFPWPPILQGLAFSALPAVLAEFIMYPQLKLMHADALVADENAWTLLQKITWNERASLLVAHIIFGAVLGALYTRPVGYSTERMPKLALARPSKPRRELRVAQRPEAAFIFASGIECSNPTIENGSWRRDLMEATGHYKYWFRDLELAAEVGLSHLRYGPPLHLTYPARGQLDWSLVDAPMEAMQRMGLTPIIDLCHFGVPDWLESFQNDEVPAALAAYATAFAKRYPWVRFYTPVNEMYVCARLSALDGIWNEQRHDETAFVMAARHLSKASVLVMHAILGERQDAVFVTSESSEFYQACCPDPEIIRIADFENERRFAPLDLAYGNPMSNRMRSHFVDHGMPEEEYDWFMNQELPRRTILGVDFYIWNEKLVDTRGRALALGELFGWYVIASQYYERYRRPMMHTETNHIDAREAPRWLWRQWHNLQLIQKASVPVVGFTWYSLTDQVDWDIALEHALGNVNPVGLFDLNRDPRPVGQTYKHLIDSFKDSPEIRECPTLKELLA
jgi:beta-glucosidase/6-phospho-beta-glucosidase/beta-galactosidase